MVVRIILALVAFLAAYVLIAAMQHRAASPMEVVGLGTTMLFAVGFGLFLLNSAMAAFTKRLERKG